jgi:hypothetical protein
LQKTSKIRLDDLSTVIKNTISLDEIPDWAAFEDLAAEYFRSRGHRAYSAGKGQDGGIDILVPMRTTDDIAPYKRRWVVQCKFYNSTVTQRDLATVNIPSLVHSYKAAGFLLICKQDVWGTVVDMFKRLRKDCRFKYKYEIWTGSEFESKLYEVGKGSLYKKYFPEYQEYLEHMENLAKQI